MLARTATPIARTCIIDTSTADRARANPLRQHPWGAIADARDTGILREASLRRKLAPSGFPTLRRVVTP